MDEDGADYADVLAEAQALGYAEADPTADVEGYDAAAKAAILAGLAFHTRVDRRRRPPRGHHRGVGAATSPPRARWASSSSCSPSPSSPTTSAASSCACTRRWCRAPTRSPACAAPSTPCSSRPSRPAQLMFYGRGAGGAPTASRGARRHRRRSRGTGSPARAGPAESTYADLEVLPHRRGRDALLRQPRRRRPARACSPTVAQAFADNGVSIQTVRQDGHGDEAGLVVRTHTRHGRRARGHHRAAAASRRRARRRRRHAGRGGGRAMSGRPWRAPVARRHRGVPRPAPRHRRDPGRHPARGRHAARRRAAYLSERTGCEVWLKVEGANPTGSFKDRGMTMAISKAVEEGAKAVICASTGNTSASRRGLRRPGRDGLRGARARRARSRSASSPRRSCTARKLLQVDGNFDDCLDPGARARRALPGRAGQLGQPVPHRGAEDRGVRDRRRPRRRARHPLPAGRQRGQHHRLLEGLHASTPPTASPTQRPRDVGLPGRGRRADRARRARHAPGDDRHRDPHRQPGVVGPGASPRATSPAASSTR